MGLVTLMTSTNYNSLGNDINIVGTFSEDASAKNTDKFVSPPLLNYVEPYEYAGSTKTLFYTEVNTNIKIGDRVFIVNGFYDSAERIKQDKYKKGSDGYLVLSIDRCKIALDIDYTGNLPNAGGSEATELMSDFVKVYYLDTYDTFVTANRQVTSRGGYLGGKFDHYQNNIAFIDYDFPAIDDGWTRTNGVTASPGFYVREPAYDPLLVGTTKGMTWHNITDHLMSGTFSLASSALNPDAGYRYFNNGKIMVMERDFVYGDQEFKSGTIYAFDPVTGKWTADVKKQSKTSPAILTKSNFRGGDFSGTFNSGVYGSKEKKIRWTGNGRWSGGTLFNTSWASGSMFSRISLPESYRATLDRNRLPYQKVNTFNNGGYGFNYIIESEFEATSIYSAIVRNTKFGSTPSTAAVENYILGAQATFEQTVTNGLFESCEFNNTKLIGGAVKNSRSFNSHMTGVKHINSWAKDSVLEKSTIIADSIIKIDGYDEWSAAERRNSNVYGATFSDDMDFKVFKFYIGEADYLKLKASDTFYLKGLRITNDPELVNFFDKKFTLGSWHEYVDDYNSSGAKISTNVDVDTFYKKGVSCAAFLTTPEENEWIYSSVVCEVPDPNTNTMIKFGYITDTVSENPNPRHSIDIFVSTRDVYGNDFRGTSFNFSTQSVSSTDYIIKERNANRIDVSKAYVIDSNIESGIVDGCDWNSGFDIAYNRDLMITKNVNNADFVEYDVTADKVNGLLTVRTQTGDFGDIEIVDRKSKVYGHDIKNGDILFISALDYYSRGKVMSFTISSSGTNYANSSSSPVGLSYSKFADYTDGFGLTVDFVSDGSGITDFIVDNPGLDYKVGDVLYLNLPGQGTNHTSGTGVDASITITKVHEEGSVRLPDSWRVIQYSPPTVVLEPLYGADLIKGLTSNGYFVSKRAKNRWYGFGRTKISSSRIKSGMFKRSHLIGNTIESTNYDATDRDFLDVEKIKSLVLSDMVFSDTGNKLSLATYYNSAIVGGTDIWNDGIIYRSLLNDMVFERGIIKQSTWLNGTFNGGLFYMSRSYDATPIAGKEQYSQDRILSHYKGGATIGTGSNDRYSWRKGNFNGGEFLKSDWEFGRFNGGLFYGSKWYDGIANGGIFGNESTATNDTVFYSGVVENTTVNNARFVADDTSRLGIKSNIVWRNGVFNGGVFGSAKNQIVTSSGVAKETWPQQPTPMNYQFDVATKNITVTVDVQSTTAVTEVDAINLMVDFSASPVLMIRNLEIRLVAPNGKIIVVKDAGLGQGNVLVGTVFSTDKSLSPFVDGGAPYKGRYAMSFGASSYLSTKSTDAADAADMLDVTDYAKGVWKVEFYSTSLANVADSLVQAISATINASIELVPKAQYITVVENHAEWNNGTFNGGEFVDYAVWKSGEFNDGKFTSTYGWTVSGIPNQVNPADKYSWQGGVFNGGEFGNSSTGANSTWRTGEFNDGTFNGRLWNSGIFRYGTFNGSGKTASGGWSLATAAAISNASEFNDSFTGEFYGLWNNGLVTDQKDVYIDSTDIKYSTEETRAVNSEAKARSAVFNNVLWTNGTFDNNLGRMNNSVWLNGRFKKGQFAGGSFNPYVVRRPGSSRDFSDDSQWIDGTFVSGDFFYSQWDRGTFVSGTALGMWFVEGTSNYMNAYNVVWGSTNSYPTWKNGNWYGSEFEYLGKITDPMHTRIVTKTHERNNLIGLGVFPGANTRLHIWNVFDDLGNATVDVLNIPALKVETYLPNYVPTDSAKIFYPPVEW